MQVTRREALFIGIGVALVRCARAASVPDRTGILNQARDGQIVIFTIHGVPDYAHPAVTTPPELFKPYLTYLKENNFNVVSVLDLARYAI